MNVRKIAATLALIPSMAAAGLDRGGNALDGGGIGAANLVATCVVSLGVGWAVKSFMDSTGRYTEGSTAIVTAIAGLFIGPLLSYFMFF